MGILFSGKLPYLLSLNFLSQRKSYLFSSCLTSTCNNYKYYLYLWAKQRLCHRDFSEAAAIINIRSSSKGGKKSFREEGTLELDLAGWIGVFQVNLGKVDCPGRKNNIGKGIEQ